LFGALVLDESPYDPSLFFVGIDTVAELSGGILGRYIFQLEVFCSHYFWWFASPPGWSVGRRVGAVDGRGVRPQLSGDAMASCHLFRPVRSTGKKHVGAADMLFLVPFKTFKDPSSEGWSVST
jgi:hypothetical protein